MGVGRDDASARSYTERAGETTGYTGTGAWHAKAVAEVERGLATDARAGLSEEEARRRIGEYGPNTLREKAKRAPVMLFLNQFNDFMIWILIVAALVSGFVLREVLDSLVIAAILLINAALGFAQEYRAENALEALKKLSAPRSKVLRGGVETQIPSAELVPGDVILLEGGDVVPADGRLVSVSALLVDEAPVTGESEASAKTADALQDLDLPLGDRINMAYSGTVVFTGRARAIVVATGAGTEMGRIAELIQVEEEKTPLQIELYTIGRVIAILVLAVAAVVFGAGLARGFDPVFMFLASVSLAVAAIPEGLPAIVTATLALGVQAMAAQNAIVRRLSAVETLGSTTVISTDKTGTLTLNRMTAEKLFLDPHVFTIEDHRIAQEEATINEADLARLLEIAVLANDARHGEGGALVGDPTETALVRLADELGRPKELLEAERPRVDEIPFDSERKRMTTIHRAGAGFLVMVKGAPEVVLARCERERAAGAERPLSEGRRAHILEVNNRLASEGFRTLAFAYKPIDVRPSVAREAGDELERGLTFAGLIGLTDPPRPEVAASIQTARRAGIRVMMVTGDHKLTAMAIAERIGLLEGRGVLTGVELEETPVEELARIIDTIGVFSRVNPEHKVKIVEALKKNGEVVAMTGDGVNDAPAVKRADIGIAMGQVGTDVTKEASDMVLADDNFATIVAAVRQGRLIFDNLKKFILFLLSCNASEVLTVFLALMIGLPVPLLPTQILWMNLITDGLPALALGVEPPGSDLMKRPPRDIKERVLSRPRLVLVSWQGLILTLAALATFVAVLVLEGEPLLASGGETGTAAVALARTVAFTTLVTVQLLHSLNYRTATTRLFSREALKNRFLLTSIAVSFALQLAVLYVPFMQELFNTSALGLREWGIICAAILPALVIIDATKRRGRVGRF